jgi:beta-xylosidase
MCHPDERTIAKIEATTNLFNHCMTGDDISRRLKTINVNNQSRNSKQKLRWVRAIPYLVINDNTHHLEEPGGDLFKRPAAEYEIKNFFDRTELEVAFETMHISLGTGAICNEPA